MKSPCLFPFILALAYPVGAQQLEIPANGAYTGAYVEGGPTEDDVTYGKLVAFEKLAGKSQAIVAFSSYWGENSFPSAQAAAVQRYGAAPLIFWCPWGPPYVQNKPQPQYALANILAGKFDAYIRDWARRARDTRMPLLVSWGLEMNGDWFPWSGSCQGAGETHLNGDPSRPDGAERFGRAFRHVVDLARAEGARNIEWVFHVQNYSYPAVDWNTMAKYYPGDDYVDWLGASVYGKQTRHEGWVSFDCVMRYPYRELAAINTNKPILVAEWGVGEFPRDGSKPAFFDEAFAAMKRDYPRLKAAIYWHERWEEEDDLYSNLRINSSPRSLDAYRRGVRDPFWLGRPSIRK